MIDDNNQSLAFFKSAINKYNQGDLLGAIQDYTLSINENPNFIQAYLKRAQVKCETKDYTLMLEAISDYSKVIELDPENADAYEGRGSILSSLNTNDNSAINDLKKAILFDPSKYMVYWNIGILCFMSNKYKETIENFNLFLNHYNSNEFKGDAYYFIGIANYHLKDFVQAINYFTESINHNAFQNLSLSFYYRALSYYNINCYDGSLSDIKHFLKLKPNDNNALSLQTLIIKSINERGVRKANDEDFKGAIEDFTKSLEYYPNDESNYTNRGLAKVNIGDLKGAIIDFTSAIEINHKNIEAYINRGVAKGNLQDFKGAIYDLTMALEFNPSNANAYMNRGTFKSYTNDINGAIDDISKAIEINPQFAEAYFNRGLISINLNKIDIGCKDLRKAGELGFDQALKLLNEISK